MFRKAIAIEPQERSYEQLGKVLVMQDKMREALLEYKQALKLTPDDADTWCQVGLLHVRQGAMCGAEHAPTCG
jgi:cytochrome c-type biogenesis protein CcmH/NrfG